MTREIVPTDPQTERAKGRITLWLEPEDLRWLAQHFAKCEEQPDERERIEHIRFRMLAALHKAGFLSNIWEETRPDLSNPEETA